MPGPYTTYYTKNAYLNQESEGSGYSMGAQLKKNGGGGASYRRKQKRKQQSSTEETRKKAMVRKG